MKPWTYLLPLALLGGCVSMTSEDMAAQSAFTVCRYTMTGGPFSGLAEQERARRGLDCTPLYPAIAAKMANDNAAVGAYLNSMNRPAPAFIAPQQANCTSRAVGNTVQTSCW